MERLMAKKREALERQAKQRQVRKPKDFAREKLPGQNGRVRDVIAKELGVSGRQVEKKIMTKVDRESRWKSAKEGGSKTEPKIK